MREMLRFPRKVADGSISASKKGDNQDSTEHQEELERILRYVKEELPRSEPRIANRVRAGCKISVAIPAYQEGPEILVPLVSLAKQDAVLKDEYEVIITVNNRQNPDVRTRMLNDLTLKVLRCIQDPTADDKFLSDEERSAVEQIRSSGLVVHGIDKSTKGNEIRTISARDFKEVGPAQPRKRTMDEICERFALAGKSDGVIASLDADTKVNPRYIKQMIDSFADDNIQLLTGERRDGLDIDGTGAVVDRIAVINRMLDYWNSDERQKDEILAEFPKIESQLQRDEILLMNQLIDAYNVVREEYEGTGRITADVIKNFKGSSGKAFRVGAYIRHGREIIEMMETAITELPEGIRKDSCRYVGRPKDDQVDAGTQDATIEALAIYPETRIRSWHLTSPDSQNPYKDFRDLHGPYGSSGKELAYAVVAVLKGKIPTTRGFGTLKRVSIVDALQRYGKKNPQGRLMNPDRYFFEVLSRAVEKSRPDERDTLKQRLAQIFQGKSLSDMPEKISYAEAAEKYRRLLNLT